MKKIFLVLFIIFLPLTVLAHQPNLVDMQTNIKIQNPDVSQAFYGYLNGQPVVYEIKIDQPLELYVSILVPDISYVPKDLVAKIYRDKIDRKTLLATLDGTKFEWTKYYEEYGGDNYWQGPEEKRKVEPGTYLVQISRANNVGQYVLVVGQKEEFPPDKMLQTLLLLPKLKMFFDKSPLLALFNLIGLYLLAALAAIAVVIILIIVVIKKIIRLFKKEKVVKKKLFKKKKK
ncbi:MAG: hypothetical protein A2Y82_04185 [Candidatus Buchananbacteria bacterium RBG_13_36_9]|uniref:Uncharacterized protein n=1 Tax=Candidatus Buchananbacteria bacterium RBG_13_36_9 TaxID=1797530 RepID=A0A1G1XRA5_9BACT|nr:MAG: hypothetical protein A2Y82_04185 [Candidatus Buchananbacteria bacterium RBG_13_36_9]